MCIRTPTLYFAWANGSFTSVDQTGGTLVYYLQRNNSADTSAIMAFPDGFRMLTGDPYTRVFDNSDMANATGWNCLGGDISPTRNPFLPPVNCPGESGPCPDGFPKRLISIFYETMWSVDPWKDQWHLAKNASQPFVLSTGDPVGYGYHGDFLNGWDNSVLQKAVDTCTDPSGVIELCPVFELTNKTTDPVCALTSAFDEQVQGTLSKLPGCNPITPSNVTYVTTCAESDPPSTQPSVTVFHTLYGNVDGTNITRAVQTSASSSNSSTSTSSTDSSGSSTGSTTSSTGSAASDDGDTDSSTSASAATSTGMSSSSSSGSSQTVLIASIGMGLVALVIIIVGTTYVSSHHAKKDAKDEEASSHLNKPQSDSEDSG
ncbi:DUF1996 domain containing protein [Pseudohyphozyma bogoriensis]|nr:DUF1996 domain containing protein [Pseudohyphozyma bogoriensis]